MQHLQGGMKFAAQISPLLNLYHIWSSPTTFGMKMLVCFRPPKLSAQSCTKNSSWIRKIALEKVSENIPLHLSTIFLVVYLEGLDEC